MHSAGRASMVVLQVTYYSSDGHEQPYVAALDFLVVSCQPCDSGPGMS